MLIKINNLILQFLQNVLKRVRLHNKNVWWKFNYTVWKTLSWHSLRESFFEHYKHGTNINSGQSALVEICNIPIYFINHEQIIKSKLHLNTFLAVSAGQPMMVMAAGKYHQLSTKVLLKCILVQYNVARVIW